MQKFLWDLACDCKSEEDGVAEGGGGVVAESEEESGEDESGFDGGEEGEGHGESVSDPGSFALTETNEGVIEGAEERF